MTGSETERALTGVWDQVLSFGQYQHETVAGEPCISVHDATTCKVMLDDFAAHPDCDIFYDKQHEVEPALGGEALDREKMRAWGQGDGHALAWANAMVMIIGGQVARYEAHPGAPESPPTADEVLVQSDGTRRSDGVFCLRAHITPRGADPLGGISSFRFTSPYYVPERDGNRLLNLTVTNDPRMRGCALAFSRFGSPIRMTRVSMANNFESRLSKLQRGYDQIQSKIRSAPHGNESGAYAAFKNKASDLYSLIQGAQSAMRDDKALSGALGPDIQRNVERSVEQVLTAGERYLAELEQMKMENSAMDPKEMTRLMEAAGCKAEDKPEEVSSKMMAYARKMEEESKKEKEASEMARKKMADEAEEMRRKMEEEDKDEKKKTDKSEDASAQAMRRIERRIDALVEKNAMLEKEVREGRVVVDSLGEKERTRKARDWAASAISMGRVSGTHKGSLDATVSWLESRYMSDPEVAEDLLSKEGTYNFSERVALQRLTASGAGINQPMPRDDELVQPGNTVKSLNDQVNQAIVMESQKLRAAGKPATFDAAMDRIKATNRKLWDAYHQRGN